MSITTIVGRDRDEVLAKEYVETLSLLLAIRQGCYGAVEDQFMEGDENWRNPRTGQTPLHVATEFGQLECAEFLLDNGADPNAQDMLGQTPLHIAAFYEEYPIAKLLLENGADPNAADAQGRTPLYWTIRYGNIYTYGLLIKHADVNGSAGEGVSLLKLAKKYGYTEIILDLQRKVAAQKA